VTAVDLAPGMAVRLAARHPEAGVLVTDAHQLAFPDRSFDLVCAGFVIHLLEDPAAAAAQARRVLVPGGVFSFSVPCGVDDAPEWDFYSQLYCEFGPLILPGEGRLGQELDGRQLLSEVDIQQQLPVPDADTFWTGRCPTAPAPSSTHCQLRLARSSRHVSAPAWRPWTQSS
jgi:SAM-dependent methyltransferase